MKHRNIPSLLLALSLLVSLCAAFALNVGAANTTRESELVLLSTSSEKNAGEGWTWDAGTCTLTLDNFTLDQSGLSRDETSYGIAIGAPDDSVIDVTIVLKGENKIVSGSTTGAENHSCGISVLGNCKIVGDADSSLTVISGDAAGADSISAGIGADGDLTIQSSGMISVKAGLADSLSVGITTSGNLAIQGSGMISVKAGHADTSCAVGCVGSLTFAGGTSTLTGEDGACVSGEDIILADHVTAKGASDYAASSVTSDVRLVSGSDTTSFAVGSSIAKTVTVTYTAPAASGTGQNMPFTDVSTGDWYYGSVYGAWKNKLISGASETLYKPNNTLTVAETIKLSAALHQLQKNGQVTLTNGTPWYSTYVAYAVEHGIIEKEYLNYTSAQMNAPASRTEFVHIFFGAMDDYKVLNDIADDQIPDVKMGDKYAGEIYTFYRAGILTGSGSSGVFNPNSTIKRSEAAAILNRMFDASTRKTITLS